VKLSEGWVSLVTDDVAHELANDATAGGDVSRGDDAELRAVRAELHALLHQPASWSFEGDEASRYTKLARLEAFLRGLAAERNAGPS
jgi:hypothetical protein